MNTHASITKENKSQLVINKNLQKLNGSGSNSQFADNRPEAVAQRKLTEMANNSPQAKQAAQLKAIAGNALQMKPMDEEELLQGKFITQRKGIENDGLLKQKTAAQENKTGLPDNLRSGIENLSGMSMEEVNVHYNSNKPEQLQALAYAQGTDIHLSPGQEKHLPHEAWHIIQQKKGRVKPTMQMKGKVNVNDDAGLEKEADVMGAKALQMKPQPDLHGAGCTCSNCSGVSSVSVPGQSNEMANKVVMQLVKCPVCDVENGHDPDCKRRQQEQRGLRMGRGMEFYGAEINRIPHAAGGVASAGSSREATHSHGNEEAKTHAINALVADGIPRNKITQSSQVRTAVKSKEKDQAAREAREEKKSANRVKKPTDIEALKAEFEISDHEWDNYSEEEQRDYIKLYRESYKNKEK